MPDLLSAQSFVAAFFASARGKLITALTVAAASLGIAAEGFSIYQSWQQIRINTYQIEIKSAESCVTRLTAFGKLAPGNFWMGGGDDRPEKKKIYEECSTYVGTKEVAKAPSSPVTPVQTEEKLGEAFEKSIFATSNAYEKGAYGEAYELARAAIPNSEALDRQRDGRLSNATLVGETRLARFALFAKDFPAALESAERALSINPTELRAKASKAHALMLIGRTAEAKELYLKHRGEKYAGWDWDKYVLQGFQELRAAGLTHPLMTEIEAEFKDKPHP